MFNQYWFDRKNIHHSLRLWIKGINEYQGVYQGVRLVDYPLQTWIRLARNNKLELQDKLMNQEKSPGDWNKTQQLEALMQSYGLNEEQVSSYCREQGLYPHHLEEWKKEFLSKNQEIECVSKLEQKKLKQENKRLQKDLNRKEKALAETAALLVLSKKCQAIWGKRRSINLLPRSQKILHLD